jgi:transcriptional regulator with XRE-family HTH domain
MTRTADRLQHARKAAGYQTASDAAHAMGASISTYLSHENGARGLGKAAERYARFYRVSLDWLLAGRGEPRSLDSRVHALPPALQEEVEKFLQHLEHRASQRKPR